MKTILNGGRVPLSEKNAFLFVLIMELLDFQKATMIGSLAGAKKLAFNNLCNHLQNWRTDYMKNWSEEDKAGFDNMAATAWEVMDAFMDAGDKRQFATLCKSFNEGLVVMEGDTVPMNQVSFEETLQRREVA